MLPQKMEAALDKTQPPGLHAGKHLQGHHHRRVLPGDSRKHLPELSFGDVKGFLAGPHPRVPFGRTGEKMSRTVIVHGKPVCVPHPFTPSLSFPGKETVPFPSRFLTFAMEMMHTRLSGFPSTWMYHRAPESFPASKCRGWVRGYLASSSSIRQ